MPQSGSTQGSPIGIPGTTPVSNQTVTGKSPVKIKDPAPNVKPPGSTANATLSSVASDVPWHHIVLWFLGAVALIALADPAPQVATMIMVLLILGTLLNNWPVYKTYLGLK